MFYCFTLVSPHPPQSPVNSASGNFSCSLTAYETLSCFSFCVPHLQPYHTHRTFLPLFGAKNYLLTAVECNSNARNSVWGNWIFLRQEYKIMNCIARMSLRKGEKEGSRNFGTVILSFSTLWNLFISVCTPCQHPGCSCPSQWACVCLYPEVARWRKEHWLWCWHRWDQIPVLWTTWPRFSHL